MPDASQALLSQPLVAFLAGAAVAALVTAVAMYRRAAQIRAQALEQSRAVLRGQVAEQLVPLTEGFPFDPSDARFLGHPVDYVVFDGLSTGDGEVEVVLVEIKTGGARLSRREAAIRDAVAAGRVRFELVRL
jgi:predicted Holliday junction resolvase-like endonuclease